MCVGEGQERRQRLGCKNDINAKYLLMFYLSYDSELGCILSSAVQAGGGGGGTDWIYFEVLKLSCLV